VAVRQRVAPLHEALCERHALRLAALSSVNCDQEDGDEAEAEAEDKSEDIDNRSNENNAGNENLENEGEIVEVLVRDVMSTGHMMRKRGRLA